MSRPFRLSVLGLAAQLVLGLGQASWAQVDCEALVSPPVPAAIPAGPSGSSTSHSEPFREAVLSLIQAALPPEVELTREQLSTLLTQPPRFELGQAALPCHSFARVLRRAPVQIAEALADAIRPHLQGSLVGSVEAVNGYLNFSADFENYAAEILARDVSGRLAGVPVVAPASQEKINIEYSQPNTHKALHVGHLRNMVFGDAVANLLGASGHQIVRSTYPGDLGTHIAKALWYIRSQQGGVLPTENHSAWLGQMYARADEHLKGLEQNDATAFAAAKEEIGRILRDVEERRGEIYELYRVTREWSLEEMRRVYEWLGVHFDQWFFESECDEPSRELVRQKQAEGLFTLSDGAVGIDLKDEGLGFAMVLKSDGTGLYLTKDLELIRRKFADSAVTRSIVVVDARQKQHFQQVFRIAELMGFPQARRSVHLAYETVNDANGNAMSSRSMNGLGLLELRRRMEERVTALYLEQHRGSWSEEEIRKAAEELALGALKYGFLKVDGGSAIRFDLDQWLRLDGDTGPELMALHAKLRGIVAEAGGQVVPGPGFRPSPTGAAEKELLFQLGRYNDVLAQAAQSYKPVVIAQYLNQLSKLVARMLQESSVESAGTPAERATRLALVQASADVLKQGLKILGIAAPSRL